MKKETGNAPVYMQIFRELRDKIVKSELKPGEILPSENDLCQKYSASRETVRKGLKELEQEGLIYSRPKRGYFVCAPRHDQFSLSLSPELQSTEHQIRDIRIMHPEPEVQRALELQTTDKIIVIYRSSYEQNTVSSLEVRHIPYHSGWPTIENDIGFAVFPEAADAKATSFSYYTELTITAVTAPENIRHMLDCDANEPLLLLTKLFISQTGAKLCYSRHYLRAPYGTLTGVSGYMQKN